MAEKGDKFIIEIDEVFRSENGKQLYKIKGFNSLVFDEVGIEKLNKYDKIKERKAAHDLGYEHGLEEAWAAAGKIENEIPIADLNKIFKSDLPGDIYSNFAPSRAMEIIRRYEKEKESAVAIGDVVTHKDTGKNCVVFNIYKEQELNAGKCVDRYVVYIIDENADLYIISTPDLVLDDFEKTGKKSSGRAFLLKEIQRYKDKEVK